MDRRWRDNEARQNACAVERNTLVWILQSVGCHIERCRAKTLFCCRVGNEDRVCHTRSKWSCALANSSVHACVLTRESERSDHKRTLTGALDPDRLSNALAKWRASLAEEECLWAILYCRCESEAGQTD